jgi:hypothetical protein
VKLNEKNVSCPLSSIPMVCALVHVGSFWPKKVTTYRRRDLFEEVVAI